ncbi:MAG: hypothetical protein ABIT37_00860 [Luteolibacter sp.]
MKNNVLLLVSWILIMPVAMAAPSGGKTYRVDKIDEAATFAKSEKLPLLFVSSTSEDFAKTATREFKNDAVIVLLERGDFKTKGLTPRLLGAFVEDGKQVVTPHLVFSTPDQSKVIAIVPGKLLGDEETVKKIKGSLPAILAGSEAAAVLPDTNWCWQSSNPSAGGWIGAFFQLGPGEMVVLQNAMGKKFQVPFSQLVPHHVAFAKTLGPAPAPEPYVSRIADEYEEPGVESWTNSEGKEVRGIFMSGNDNVLTLKLENGKEAKVPFDKLSSQSRVRATALAIRKALRPKN